MSENPGKKTLSLKGKNGDDGASRIEERLHKVLAQAGLGSRRALEERIAQGMIKVNGEVARTGSSISSGDRVELDGKTFVATALTEPSSVLIYNKPEGQVTTRGFLDYFGLKNLDDLPSLSELKEIPELEPQLPFEPPVPAAAALPDEADEELDADIDDAGEDEEEDALPRDSDDTNVEAGDEAEPELRNE